MVRVAFPFNTKDYRLRCFYFLNMICDFFDFFVVEKYKCRLKERQIFRSIIVLVVAINDLSCMIRPCVSAACVKQDQARVSFTFTDRVGKSYSY